MPGDPLRAKYIAENFLENVKLVNEVRGMYAYTGEYKGCKITIMASGMGIPSMGIYSLELFKFYNVDNIIRIGTCGALDKDMKMLDLILVDKTYTESNYALALDNIRCYIGEASSTLNETILKTAQEQGIDIQKRNTVCNEIFDPYHPKLYDLIESFPNFMNLIVCKLVLYKVLRIFLNTFSFTSNITLNYSFLSIYLICYVNVNIYHFNLTIIKYCFIFIELN